MNVRAWAIPGLLLAIPAVASGGAQDPYSYVRTQAPPAQSLPTCAEMAAALRTVVRHDDRLKDWAELGRYADANRAVKPPATGERRVLFLGDSITDIWQQPEFGGFFPGKPYLDRGISGQTTPQMLVRFRPDVIDLQPKAVVILAGTNDIAGNTGPMTNEQIEQNLESMSDLAHAHGIKVVLASILPVSDYHHSATSSLPPQTTLRPMARITAINEWMKRYAASHGDVYLDYFSAMTDDRGLLRTGFSVDDLHPTAAGFAVMAPLAEAAIEHALGGG